MLLKVDGGPPVATQPTPPPAAPQPTPPPQPQPTPPPVVPSSAPAVNANGETLAQAEAAVLAEVAAGALGAEALARHPLPPGTPTAEALRFLASLPQTTYQISDAGSGVVTGPPIDTVTQGDDDFGPDAGDDDEMAWENDPGVDSSPELLGDLSNLDNGNAVIPGIQF